MNTEIIVFLGPTLSKNTAKKHLNALYLPPAEKGDIIGITTNLKPKYIALIDGVFYQSMSVWHREIIYALDCGVEIYGSSSMGALRAAELAPYGMTGIGKVFDSYLKGETNDDDEVALIHADQKNNYMNLTIPFINIKETLNDLLRKQIIDKKLHEKLFQKLKKINFKLRTQHEIKKTFSKILGETSKANELFSIFQANYVDQKKLDAILLLQTLSNKVKSTQDERQVVKLIANNSEFYNHERFVYAKNGKIRLGNISNYAALHLKDFETLNFSSANRYLVSMFSRINGFKIEKKEWEKESLRFKLRRNILDENSFSTWLSTNDITKKDFEMLIEEICLCKKMQLWLFHSKKSLERNSKYLLDELKLKGNYELLKSEAICHYNEHAPNKITHFNDKKEALLNYAQQGNCEIWQDYQSWHKEAGFQHEDEFIHEMRYFLKSKKNNNKNKSNFHYSNWMEEQILHATSNFIVRVEALQEQKIKDAAKRFIKLALQSNVFDKKINFFWILDDAQKNDIEKLNIFRNYFDNNNIYSKEISHNIIAEHPKNIDKKIFATFPLKLTSAHLIVTSLSNANDLLKILGDYNSPRELVFHCLLDNNWLTEDSAQQILLLSSTSNFKLKYKLALSNKFTTHLKNLNSKQYTQKIKQYRCFIEKLVKHWSLKKISVVNFDDLIVKIIGHKKKIRQTSSNLSAYYFTVGLIYYFDCWSFLLLKNLDHQKTISINQANSFNQLTIAEKKKSKFFADSEKACQQDCNIYPLCKNGYFNHKIVEKTQFKNSETISCIFLEKIMMELVCKNQVTTFK